MFEARVGSLRGLVVGEGLRVSRSKNGDTVVNKRLSRLVEFYVSLEQCVYAAFENGLHPAFYKGRGCTMFYFLRL